MSKTVKVPDVPHPTTPLCWKLAPSLVRCDRMAGHKGGHSWEHSFVGDYQRMWDLVRAMRGPLLDAELITREEYATLLQAETMHAPSGTGSPSPRRLESYDELRTKLDKAERECDRLGRRVGVLEGIMGTKAVQVAIAGRSDV